MSQISVAPPVPRRRRLPSANALRLFFLRMLALVFLVVGVMEWGELLGALHLGQPDFFTLNLQGQATVMFFAVADLVAAIGLWLTATWGLVIWFLTASTRIVRHTVFASSFGWDWLDTSAEALGIVAFVVLVIFTERERRREIARQRENRRNRAIE